jgi:hypothetical protein
MSRAASSQVSLCESGLRRLLLIRVSSVEKIAFMEQRWCL